MGNSIQEFLKKINSSLSSFDVISFFATALFAIVFALFVVYDARKNDLPISYISKENEMANPVDNRPFASRNGATYTFSWCQGASMILEKNKVYFANEEEAESSGKTLSKLCQK